MLQRQGQLLACDFVVTLDGEDLAAALEAIPLGAVHTGRSTRSHRIDVVRHGGSYRIREDGEVRVSTADAATAGQRLRERIQALALAAMDDHAKVHAGLATWDGRSFLVAGPGRAGKSTFMTRLLYEGALVQGDDTVVLRDGWATAFPRRFGLRRGTLSLIPQLTALTPPWAQGAEPDGYHILTVDPATLGFPWRIEPVLVDAIFFAEPARGQSSRAVPSPRYAMARRLMSQSLAPGAGARAWIREIAAAVGRAECFVLELGELDSAVRAVRTALTESPPSSARP